MNRGSEMQGSLVQQLMIQQAAAAGGGGGVGGGSAGNAIGWWGGGGGGERDQEVEEASAAPEKMAASMAPSALLPSAAFFFSGAGGHGHFPLHLGSMHEMQHAEPSLSQLLLSGGIMAGDETYNAGLAGGRAKKMGGWDGGQPAAAVHPAAVAAYMAGMKQEAAASQAGLVAAPPYGNASEEIMAGGGHKQSALSQLLLASSPRSCVTSSLGSGMLDFSSCAAAAVPDVRTSENSSECNSASTGAAFKKAKVHQAASSSAQSTLKVRKERLGDRITALHQIVSPFGKTDTASVLQETSGYIRFLLGQIKALSYPYLGQGNGSSMMQQQQQHGPGERSPCLFPDLIPPPAHHHQLIRRNNNADAQRESDHHEMEGEDEEQKKDLRARGLCLVPVTCASHFGGGDSINGGDFWASALGGVLR